jgi:NDP-sugar pyrophosphorylase family protein
MLAYGLEHLASAGIRRAGFNLHHRAETIPPVVDRLGENMGIEPSYAREWERLGTAGGIRGIWRALDEPNSTLVVANADMVMNTDLGTHLEAHQRSEAEATLLVRPTDDDGPGGVWLDDDRTLQGMREFRTPDYEEGATEGLDEYAFAGVHFLEPSLLRDTPLEEGCIIEDVYGPRFREGDRLRASIQTGFWAPLDRPELIMEATRRVLDAPDAFEQAPLPESSEEGLFLFGTEPDADGVEFAPPVFCGPDVEFGSGVRLGPYTVVDGATLAPGTQIRESLVYGAGTVEEDRDGEILVADQSVALDADDTDD